ncbi:NAD(P)H-binding protein [Streptomyces sp. 900105755]
MDHNLEARMRPVLVTGAAGRAGAVGRTVVEGLRRRGLTVRALVRRDDDCAAALRATGAEVVVGDLTSSRDVAEALDGCGRMYFGTALSEQHLPAAVTTAVAARAYGGLEAFVNMSQLTVSEMDLTSTSELHQHRQKWLVEELLGWSGLPLVQVRPTVFLENPLFQVGFSSIPRDGTIRLPFGQAKTSRSRRTTWRPFGISPRSWHSPPCLLVLARHQNEPSVTHDVNGVRTCLTSCASATRPARPSQVTPASKGPLT